MSKPNSVCKGVEAIEEEVIDIRRFVGILLARWWLLVLFPLVLALLALLYSRNQEPVYEAQATLLVNPGSGNLNLSGNDFSVSNRLAGTYKALVVSAPFLEKVAAENGLPFSAQELKAMTSALRELDPPILEIRVRSGDPRVAADTAQAISLSFIDFVVEKRLSEIARLQSAAAAQGIVNVGDMVAAQISAVDSLSLLEPVTVPGKPVLPRTRQNVMLAIIVGIVLASALSIVLETLGDTVRNPETVTRRFGVSTLGSIFKWTSHDADDRELVLWKNPKSNYAEAFRQLRANLQFATANRQGNLYLLCSPGPGEGKSTITCNLAIALANTGKNVVVIDGDLRRATVHHRFENMKKEPGLSNYLAEFTSDISAIVQRSEADGVSVITSGPTPPNPAELLGSARMTELLATLKQEYDVVLIDSAPVLLVADGSILAAQADGAVIVVDGTRTKMSSLQATINTLRNANVDILGLVINKLKRSRFGYGYGYSYYYSGYNYYGAPENDSADAWKHGKIYNRPYHWLRWMFSKYRSRRA